MYWAAFFILLLIFGVGSRPSQYSIRSGLFWMGVKFAIAALFAFFLAFGLSFDGWFQDVSAILGIFFVIMAIVSFVQAKREKA